jgi:hypothetical protein
MTNLKYRVTRDEWVDVISITPINKVNSYYEGLNLIIQNELKFIILFINDKGVLEHDEIDDYNFKRDIK